MSWRDVAADLCTTRPVQTKPLTQNTQKPPHPGNSTDIMDFAYRDGKPPRPESGNFADSTDIAYRDEESPARVDGLLDALEVACKDLPVTPGFVLSALSRENKADWQAGELPPETLRDFSKALSWRRAMDQGEAGPRTTTPSRLMPSMRPGLALRTGDRRQALRMKISFNLPYPPTINTYWRHVGGRAMLSKRGRQYRNLATEKLLG